LVPVVRKLYRKSVPELLRQQAQPTRARGLGVLVEHGDGEATADVLEREDADGDFGEVGGDWASWDRRHLADTCWRLTASLAGV
jgi:hypothetical protein